MQRNSVLYLVTAFEYWWIHMTNRPDTVAQNLINQESFSSRWNICIYSGHIGDTFYRIYGTKDVNGNAL